MPNIVSVFRRTFNQRFFCWFRITGMACNQNLLKHQCRRHQYQLSCRKV